MLAGALVLGLHLPLVICLQLVKSENIYEVYIWLLKLFGLLCQLQSDPRGDHVLIRWNKKITPSTGGRKYMATG